MDSRKTTHHAPTVATAGMDHSEEMLAEVDEPPDELHWSPTKLHFGYMKSYPSMQRRESMLTRQLHSETEHTDDEQPGRAMSTQSTWSTQSATSVTELTSDDGKSAPSPAISPPLPPTHHATAIPVTEKPLDQRVKIVGQEDAAAIIKDSRSEKSVEANLGRKRCISFACRGKQETKPVSPPTSHPVQEPAASPPKRKCMLKFVCPTKNAIESRAAEKPQTKRAVSPPPPLRRSSSKPKHRGSDSTVTHVSPKGIRKGSLAASTTPVPPPVKPVSATSTRRYSIASDDEDNDEARFHEFGSNEAEANEWVQESTCHRKRLTVDDTLKKELSIRKTCEEAAAEVMEEDDNDDDDLEDELDDVDDVDGEVVEDDDESDDGFHSDDEGGFASSDSDRDDDSDFEWWRPGGASTAATSVEHLDRLAIVNSQQIEPGSSVNTDHSDQLSPRTSRSNFQKTSSKTKASSAAIPITSRRGSIDLPDSTDFVCGTLDEDRPLEQAYINRKKAKDALRRPSRPQDIDPSFPTSDPEMDEEDDDDVDEVPESDDDDDLMHGALDDMDDLVVKAASPPLRRGRTSNHRSPPLPARVHTPPPKRTMARSPAPTKRAARSPAPRKLFGHSPPLRLKSPAPAKRMTSPPNSPAENTSTSPLTVRHGLGTGRPQLTHTASLPRTGPFAVGRTSYWPTSSHAIEDMSDTATEVPRRGAIDIVKGVELKRQRRREKLHQKMCAKYAMKGEKSHKVKPGRGAERMREVGLQLQEYKGKAEHILSL